MKTPTSLALTVALTTIGFIAACDSDEAELAVAFEPELIELSDAELELLAPEGHESTASTLTCAVDEQASVAGLTYPGWTCNDAIAQAESTLGSWHYRNACNQQVGSDISLPADAASASCTMVNGDAVVAVDLCCVPPPSLSCDVADQASVAGLAYPGWTCNDAIAQAESTLGSWHYRNACNQQVGSDISLPADEALVSGCTIVNGAAVVDVDLCCVSPMVPGIPSVTQKMCIPAGTPQQMLASCESEGQIWANLFINNTFTTQQYISLWTDPCPAGTSVVPNTQFYVANSCNPQPTIGVDCYGPGSFNYEFKLGVLCL